MNQKIRINKYLSDLGIASRRRIDELISGGNIIINNKKASLGEKVSDEDEIRLNGKIINTKKSEPVIYALNKPCGVLSTTHDELGRKTVIDLIKTKERLYPVGRLDKASTGLIILTNDGNLAYKLTHPKFEVEKEYLVSVNKLISDEKIKKLEAEIKTKNTSFHADKVTKIGFNKYSIILHEGKNREIKKMLSAIGIEVLGLKRTRIGKLELGNLEEASYRKISEDEI